MGLIERAAEHWREGKPLEAGKLVFEGLSLDNRPQWASKILRLVLQRSRIRSTLFDEVLKIADEKSLWRSGHQAFSRLRAATLKIDQMERMQEVSETEQLFGFVVALAELVAKVIYNSTNPADGFDEDSGWWIAASLKGFVDYWNDPEFSSAAMAAVLGWETGEKRGVVQ